MTRPERLLQIINDVATEPLTRLGQLPDGYEPVEVYGACVGVNVDKAACVSGVIRDELEQFPTTIGDDEDSLRKGLSYLQVAANLAGTVEYEQEDVNNAVQLAAVGKVTGQLDIIVPRFVSSEPGINDETARDLMIGIGCLFLKLKP